MGNQKQLFLTVGAKHSEAIGAIRVIHVTWQMQGHWAKAPPSRSYCSTTGQFGGLESSLRPVAALAKAFTAAAVISFASTTIAITGCSAPLC